MRPAPSAGRCNLRHFFIELFRQEADIVFVGLKPARSHREQRRRREVTLRHQSSHQPPSAGTADTCVDSNTFGTKCPRVQVVSTLRQMKSVSTVQLHVIPWLPSQGTPNSQQYAYDVDSQPSGAAKAFTWRPDKGHQLAFHCYIETHVALFPWRMKAKTIESVFPHPKQRLKISQ